MRASRESGAYRTADLAAGLVPHTLESVARASLQQLLATRRLPANVARATEAAFGSQDRVAQRLTTVALAASCGGLGVTHPLLPCDIVDTWKRVQDALDEWFSSADSREEAALEAISMRCLVP